MFPTPCDACIVTIHAVDPLGRLREYKLLDPLLAHLAIKAVRVIRVVAGHDGLVKDRQATDVAAIRAVRADRGAIG